MTNTPMVPSHFTFPFATTIQSSRYDSRGRQMGFIESEVQRLERLAFANASKSRTSSPTESHSSSSTGSPVSPPIFYMCHRPSRNLKPCTRCSQWASFSFPNLSMTPSNSSQTNSPANSLAQETSSHFLMKTRTPFHATILADNTPHLRSTKIHALERRSAFL
jgi:hypothetical protein